MGFYDILFPVPALKGQKVASLGITEPNAGSDVASIETRAVKDGDQWVINGRKIFITNGVRADFIVLVAKTTPEMGYNEVSLFLVDKGTQSKRLIE
ncbi:MAG: acyl-CoA dehydrogenase family protein [Bacillota bacterium]